MRRHLPRQLSFRDSLLFPIQSSDGRRDILIGGLAVIFLLPIGWILNLGARLDVVHRLYTGDRPYFRGMKPFKHTLRRGCVSALTIFSYLFPANICFGLFVYGAYFNIIGAVGVIMLLLGLFFFALGVFTLPGCMTVYACEEDPSVLWKPIQAFRRAWIHRKLYLKAWCIAILSILLSFFGLIFFMVGFFFSSVWAWEVVGYAFTIAMYFDPELSTE